VNVAKRFRWLGVSGRMGAPRQWGEALSPGDRWKVAVIPREGEWEAEAEERQYRERPDERGLTMWFR
jgi:hypothetical protein